MHQLQHFHLSSHLIYIFLDATSIRPGVAKPRIRVARSFRCLRLRPGSHWVVLRLVAPLEWSAPMTVTLITEDIEVPDFLWVAIPYEALFP
jgi:hypothetical protein